MKIWSLILAGLLVVAVAGSATAQTLPGNYAHSLRFTSGDKAQSGLLVGTAVAGSLWGQFGMEFAGPTVVTSFTIQQLTGSGYGTMQTLYVWADGVRVGTLTLPNQHAKQTVNFADYLTDPNLGLKDMNNQPLSSISATWLTLTYKGAWAGSGSIGGIAGYSFGGPSTRVDNNPNINAIASRIEKVETTNAFTSTSWEPNGTGTNKGNVIDGFLYDNANGVAWSKNDTTDRSLIITYNNPETISSIGLCFLLGSPSRSTPKEVTISGSKEGQSVTVKLNLDLLQYNRYDLTMTQTEWDQLANTEWLTRSDDGLVSFVNTKSLTLTFPTGTANWNAGDTYCVLGEFQAFKYHQGYIPEPTTMTLLALGGLALLRRRAR